MNEAWIDLPDENSVRDELPQDIPYDFGFLPAMTRLMYAHPYLGPSLSHHFGRVMFGPGELDRREREMVAAVASAAQDCFY